VQNERLRSLLEGCYVTIPTPFADEPGLPVNEAALRAYVRFLIDGGLNADNATVSGTLTYGGTLTLTNIGSPLVAGDTFNLFDAGTTTGSFSSITFPAGTTPADWINNLGTIGSLTYVPEPGSVGMGLLATAMLARPQRKAFSTTSPELRCSAAFRTFRSLLREHSV